MNTNELGLLEQLNHPDIRKSENLDIFLIEINTINYIDEVQVIEYRDLQTYLWLKFKDRPKDLETFLSQSFLQTTYKCINDTKGLPSHRCVDFFNNRLRSLKLCADERLLSKSRKIADLSGYKTSIKLLEQAIHVAESRQGLSKKLTQGIIRLIEEKLDSGQELSREDKELIELL